MTAPRLPVDVGFEHAIIGMSTATVHGELVSVNAALATSLPGAAPGRPLRSLFRAADRAAVTRTVTDAAGGEVTPVVVASEAGRDTLLVVSPIVEDDSISYLLIQTLDVNERQRLTVQVEELLRTTRDGVFGTDDGGRVTLWNAAAEAHFGVSAEAMIGRPLAEVLPLAGPEEPLRRIEPGATWPDLLSVLAVRADGSRFEAEVALSVSRTGSTLGLIGIVRDVTARSELLTRLTDQTRRLGAAEQLAQVGSFEWDVASDTVAWSDGLFAIYGLEPETFAGTWRAFLDLVHPADREAVVEAVSVAVESGDGWQLDERIRRPDGTERVMATTGSAVRDSAGRVVRLQGVCHDVTEQRAAEAALRLSEQSFRHGFDDAPAGIALVRSVAGRWEIIRCNRALARLLDRPREELAGRVITDFTTGPEAELLASSWSELVASPDGRTSSEVRVRRRDGEVRTVVTAASRMSLDGGPDDPVIVHLEDVTARKVAEAELRHRALHDALTGLPNRALLLDRLDSALDRAGRSGRVVGVLFCDVDGFTRINHSLGHEAGDRLLTTLAGRLRQFTKSGDTVARLAADEFVLVLDNLPDLDALAPVVGRVHALLELPVQLPGGEVRTTSSIGVSVGRGRGDRAAELVRDADTAMHRAKLRGTNQYEMFDAALRDSALQRVTVEQQLRVACDQDQLVVHYQPVADIGSGSLVGFEALVRWQHPTRGLLPPAEFFSVIEGTDMVHSVGRHVLDVACRQLAAWRRDHPELRMAVNVSGRQLDGSFAATVTNALASTGLTPGALDLEVTETVLLDMSDGTADEVRSLDRLGVGLGIDDFGTGYSSMSYLKRLPVRFIKVDRSFVHGMTANSEDAAIVAAVVGLGAALSLSVTAEGVESREQLASLTRLGCTRAQGFLFAEPRDADGATALIEHWSVG